MAAPAEKKRFADAVVSRFGKGVGPAAPAAGDDDEAGGDDSGTDKEAVSMLRAGLKSGDDASVCEAIRRIAG